MNTTSEWNKQFYPRDYIKGHLYWTKAKVLAQHKNFKEAIDYTEKIKILENTSFYDKENEEESIDFLLELWKTK